MTARTIHAPNFQNEKLSHFNKYLLFFQSEPTKDKVVMAARIWKNKAVSGVCFSISNDVAQIIISMPKNKPMP